MPSLPFTSPTRLRRSAAEIPPAALTTRRGAELATRPGDIIDTEGHLAAAYDASDRTLVLIRPDGHIGLISDAGDVRAVTDYLAAIN